MADISKTIAETRALLKSIEDKKKAFARTLADYGLHGGITQLLELLPQSETGTAEARAQFQTDMASVEKEVLEGLERHNRVDGVVKKKAQAVRHVGRRRLI